MLDRYGADLELENTTKEILRTASAAMLMATTLMPYMTSTVMWWNACLAKNYKGKYVNKGSFDTHTPKKANGKIGKRLEQSLYKRGFLNGQETW